MPLTRPDVISDRICLSDKLGTLVAVRGFVSEHSAVDPLLSAVINEFSPNKHGIGVAGSECDDLAGANEL